MEYCEELDEVKVQNALFQNKISLLNANLTNLTQEHEEIINILKEEVIRKQNEITLANEALNELNTKFNRKLDEISDLNNQYDEYQKQSSELEHELETQLKQTEERTNISITRRFSKI
jgi:chromosome segregation ATPase